MKKKSIRSGLKMAQRFIKDCPKSNLKADEPAEDEPTQTQDETPDGDGGSVTGYAATFDREPDSYGDVIAPGAFTETLARWAELNAQGKYIPLLYGHNACDPDYNIGFISAAEEDERGLLVTAQFDPENPKAQYVRKLVQEGRVYQFSFAYDVLACAEVKLDENQTVNELQKLDIFEISLVQIPANQHATVEDVKARGAKAGRRNSKADEDGLNQILQHATAIQEIVSGLIAAEDKPEDDDGTADDDASAGTGDGAGAGAEDQEAKADFLKAYKDAVKTALSD